MSREVGRIRVNIVRNALDSILAGMTDQLVQKDWEALTKLYSLEPLPVVIKPYPWFIHAVIQIQVISQRSDVFISLKQEETVLKAEPHLQGLKGVDTTAGNRSPEIDEAILFLTDPMLKNLSALFSTTHCITSVINGQS